MIIDINAIQIAGFYNLSATHYPHPTLTLPTTPTEENITAMVYAHNITSPALAIPCQGGAYKPLENYYCIVYRYIIIRDWLCQFRLSPNNL